MRYFWGGKFGGISGVRKVRILAVRETCAREKIRDLRHPLKSVSPPGTPQNQSGCRIRVGENLVQAGGCWRYLAAPIILCRAN